MELAFENFFVDKSPADRVSKVNNNILPTLIFGASTIFLVWCVHWHWKRRHLYRAASKINGPNGLPIIGNAIEFATCRDDFFKVLGDYVKQYGSPIRGWLGPEFIVGITDVKDIEMLFNSPVGSVKGFALKFAADFLGNGLIGAPVNIWKPHRKLIQPTFRQQILDSFVEIFSEQADILTNCLKQDVGKEIDVVDRLFRFSMDTICETAMGVKLNNQTTKHTFCKHLQRAINVVFTRTYNILLHPDPIFKMTDYHTQIQEDMKVFSGFSDKIIKMKREEYRQRKHEETESEAEIYEAGFKRKTFLDLLIENSESGSAFTDKELGDETMTFLVAGSDTTAVSISYALLCLALYPEIQEMVYEEVTDQVGNDRLIEKEDLSKLNYLERVIKESMRFFPIVPAMLRKCDEDLVIHSNNNVLIPKGTTIAVLIFLVHFDPVQWPEPTKFNPDRFLAEASAKRSFYAYLPFGAGQRNCIGQKYAMMSMKTTIATLVRKYKFFTDYTSLNEIKMIVNIVSKPKDGFKLYIKERS